MLIELNKNEQTIVEHMARKRYEHCRNVGARPTLYNETESMENEVNSFGGEVAFCKHFNLYPDLTDDRFGIEDCTMADGNTVDVKTTPHKNGKLLIKKLDKKERPDYYALVVGTFPRFRYIGMVRTEVIIVPERIDHFFKEPGYAMTQAELLEVVYG
jgi:hypothetical protein